MWWAFKDLVKQKPWQFALIQIFIVIQVIADISVPILLSNLNRALFSKDITKEIILYSLLMIGLAIISFLVGLGSWITSAKISAYYRIYLRNKTFSKIHTFSFKDLNKFKPSSIIRRLSMNINDLILGMEMIVRVVSRSSLLLLGGLFATIIIVYTGDNSIGFTSSRKEYVIVIFTIFFVFLSFLIVALITFVSNKRYAKLQPAIDKYNTMVQELVLGIRFIKAFNMQKSKFNNFQIATNDVTNKYIAVNMIELAIGPVITFLMNFVILIVLWSGSIFKIINITQIISLVQTLTLMMIGMLIAVFVLSSLAKLNIAGKQVNEILTHKPSMQFLDSNQSSDKIKSYNIQFSNVNFSYYKNSEKVLKNINLQINEGETIGIIGKTGSGKTSLISLIPRLYEVYDGQILLGDHDIKTYTKQGLRSQIAFVPQKNNLFSGTIAYNLQFAKPNASDAEMWNALELACADSFIRDKDQLLNSNVQQRGANFSGGQKQRLCIARALMLDAPILILDDSTSALDAITEKKLLTNLKKLRPKLTKIIVSQKISSIYDADKIVVMDNGAIIGFNTHSNLLKTCPIYYEIFKSQTEK